MSECQKWPHIQSLSQRRASLSLIAGKKALMPWPGLPILGGSWQLDIWVTDIRPVIARECHQQCPGCSPLTTTRGSGLKGWVTQHRTAPLQPLSQLSSRVQSRGPGTVAPDTVYHVIISLSIVCFLIRQERKLIFLCISQPSVTLLSQTSRSTSLCICSFDCKARSGEEALHNPLLP